MNTDHQKNITVPVFAILAFIIFTFFPVIYKYAPIFGRIRIVLIISIIMIASYLVSYKKYQTKKETQNSVFYLWASILVLMVLGWFISYDPERTLQVIIENIENFVVAYVMVKVIDNSEKLDLIIKCFFTCAVFMSVQTIYNVFYSPSILEMGFRAVALEKGLFGDSNDLAMLNITALPFAFYFILVKKNRVLAIAGFFFITVATILTYSRGGFLGLCMVLTSSVYYFGKKNKRFIIYSVVIIALILQFSPPSYVERISTISDVQVDTLTGKTYTRIDDWMVALKEGVRHPILGVGAGSSSYVHGFTSGDWHHTHNAFIRVFLELGVISFIFYLLIYAMPFRKYRSIAKYGSDIIGKDLIVLKVILVVFLSYGTTVFFLPQSYSVLLYMIASIYVIHNKLLSKSHISLMENNTIRYRSSRTTAVSRNI